MTTLKINLSQCVITVFQPGSWAYWWCKLSELIFDELLDLLGSYILDCKIRELDYMTSEIFLVKKQLWDPYVEREIVIESIRWFY